MKRVLLVCCVLSALIGSLPSKLESQGRCSINRIKVHCTDGKGCGGFEDCLLNGGTYIYAHSIDYYLGCMPCTGAFGTR